MPGPSSARTWAAGPGLYLPKLFSDSQWFLDKLRSAAAIIFEVATESSIEALGINHIDTSDFYGSHITNYNSLPLNPRQQL
jgi:hypothetical protein